MFRTYCPRDLWSYGILYVSKIMQIMASFATDLQGRTPLEALTGETPDISQYLDFGFYDWVWFKEDAGLGETKLGRFLGVSHHIGSLMNYWVFASKRNIDVHNNRITSHKFGITNRTMQETF